MRLSGVFSYFTTLNQAAVRPIRLTLFALFICQVSFAQSCWAKGQAGQNVDETQGVVSVSEANVYSRGYFSTSAEINGRTLAVQRLTDVFVSKVSLTGEALWSVSFGGSQSGRGLGISVDKSGNVLVSCFFTGTVSFGNDITLSSIDGKMLFCGDLIQRVMLYGQELSEVLAIQIVQTPLPLFEGRLIEDTRNLTLLRD